MKEVLLSFQFQKGIEIPESFKILSLLSFSIQIPFHFQFRSQNVFNSDHKMNTSGDMIIPINSNFDFDHKQNTLLMLESSFSKMLALVNARSKHNSAEQNKVETCHGWHHLKFGPHIICQYTSEVFNAISIWDKVASLFQKNYDCCITKSCWTLFNINNMTHLKRKNQYYII